MSAPPLEWFLGFVRYALESEEGGRLSLPSSLYLPRRERDEAALILENGVERGVIVTFEPAWGAATFVFVDRPRRV